MAIDLALAIFLTRVILGIGLVISAVEFLQIKKWLANDFSPRKTFVKNWWQNGLTICLLFFLVLSCSLFFYFGAFQIGLVIILLLSISKIFFGPFNGGSDSMCIQILLGLLICSLTAANVEKQEIGMLYISLQVSLSYFLAGLSKVKNVQWRSGTALSLLLRSPHFAIPKKISGLARHQSACRIGQWAVIIFEVTFPIIFMFTQLAPVFLGIGLLFHLLISYALGLNRFLLTWFGTYPALLYVSQKGNLQI